MKDFNTFIQEVQEKFSSLLLEQDYQMLKQFIQSMYKEFDDSICAVSSKEQRRQFVYLMQDFEKRVKTINRLRWDRKRFEKKTTISIVGTGRLCKKCDLAIVNAKIIGDPSFGSPVKVEFENGYCENCHIVTFENKLSLFTSIGIIPILSFVSSEQKELAQKIAFLLALQGDIDARGN